jgi:hypothetical protein
MVEHEVAIGLDMTSIVVIADDEHFVPSIRLVTRREKCKSVSFFVFETRLDKE